MNSKLSHARRLAVILIAVASGLGPNAQSPGSPPLDQAGFRVPIHTGAPDPVFGRYGTWASGDSYKVSFHDGMVFHPVMGAESPGYPLRWTTTSVRIGSRDLMQRPPASRHDDWRFEYDHGEVIEAYDVRPNGVEQSFVIATRPVGGGVLVVEGRLETDLAMRDSAPTHGSIVFREPDGTSVLQYGAAVAIDADGRRIPMTTEVDRGTIRLRLGADDVSRLRFPLVVDPLLAPALVGSLSGAVAPSQTEIARDDKANDLMVAICRAVSATDFDVFVRITEDDFSASKLVFTDVTSSWSTRSASCGYVKTPKKWCVALERQFTNITGLRVHCRDSGDYTLATSIVAPSIGAENQVTRPRVGGAQYGMGDNALIVYQNDVATTRTNTSSSDVWGVLFDTGTGSFGAEFALDPGPVGFAVDREAPSVTEQSGGAWTVAWQEYAYATIVTDWNVYVGKVGALGTPVAHASITNGVSNHCVGPRIAGTNGRYAVAYAKQQNTGVKHAAYSGDRADVQRFDWSLGPSAPTILSSNLLRTGSGLWIEGIASDVNSLSHWCVVTRLDGDIQADRIDYETGVCEAVDIYVGPNRAGRAAVAFNDDVTEFPIVYITDGSNVPVLGRIFQYRPANTSSLGAGCGSATISSDAPHMGSEFFSVNLDGAAGLQNCFLLIGTSPAAIPLDSLGMIGCNLYTPPVANVPRVTNVSGETRATMALPAPTSGDIYFQWLYRNPAAPGGFETTGGLLARIR